MYLLLISDMWTRSIVLHSDVHEGSEVHDVAHGAFQLHVDLEVVEGSHIVPEDHCRRILTGIASRLLHFFYDVRQRRYTDFQLLSPSSPQLSSCFALAFLILC